MCQRLQGGGSQKEFNDWIAELEVEDVPSVGRKFTWNRPNGTAKRKIDRILVSAEWFSKWQDNIQLILDRNFYDHCPIL